MKLPISKPKKLTPIMKAAIIVLIVAVAIYAIYLVLDRAGYIRAFQLGRQLQQQEQAQSQDAKVLESLKQIILLPDDFTPTMAVINDIDALKAEQPDFFAFAKNGDRVVVYPTLAIIYDYEAGKIIKVGPVQVQQQEVPVAEEETNMEISQ